MNIIDKKNKILIKPIHPIIQTIEDLKNNILKKDEVILDAIRNGVVLKNQESIINLIEDVTSNKTY